MTNAKSYILIAVVALIAGAIYFLNLNSAGKSGSSEPVAVTPRATSDSNEIKKETIPSKFLSAEAKSKRYELAKEITTPDGFINTDGKPITINGLIGKKVILVDFWTYSCINCQRTTPYLNAWYEKYKDKGFVIIGVHTPEFEFEKDYNNVKAAVEKFGIKFPVVLDNDYSTWTAYKNQYWPRKYLIDIDGYIIYDHIGEGAYEEIEKKIQELLEERAEVLKMQEKIAKDISRPSGTNEIDFSRPRSPEIYFGAARNTYLGNGKTNTIGVQSFSEPTEVKTNTLYLVGDWSTQEEFAQNKTTPAKITFRYNSKNVYFVASSDTGARIKILKDGKLERVDLIKEARLYKLIEDSKYGEHTLEIIIENPGLRAFTFTFG